MTPPDPARFRAIFFDAGFTLIYPDPPLPERSAAVARAHGLTVEAAQIAAVMKQGEGFFAQNMREAPDTWASDDAVIAFWRRYYAHLFDIAGVPPGPALDAVGEALYHIYNEPGSWALYPDALPAITALHAQGYRLGIISDWGTRLAHRILLPLGLGRYFDFMVVSATVGTAKPGQPLFTEAVRRAGVAPHEALHVGDSYLLDVLGARAAGVTPVLLDRRDHLGPVDCAKIRSLAELPALVAALEGREALKEGEK